MYNKKHFKTIFSRNDTLMTLFSSVVMFVLPIIVFSFCYYMQYSLDAYAIKNVKTLDDDLSVVSSIQIARTNLAIFDLD